MWITGGPKIRALRLFKSRYVTIHTGSYVSFKMSLLSHPSFGKSIFTDGTLCI